uniref:Uncharacterized protein n=1 Tax=Anopheles coluzzii TaxID=1518534 RepID=A0A8W7PH66_ANOCL
MCPRCVSSVMPQMTPRASGSQYGAYSPLNAGTKYTSPLFSTSSAADSDSEAPPIRFRLSRNQPRAAPATATEPSSAYTGSASGPICRKHPVPYVAFARPRVKHSCPTSADCWSPRQPASGMCCSGRNLISPYTSELDRMVGSISSGTSKNFISALSYLSVSMFISMVRDAFDTSVTWAPPSGPPVRFQISHVSTVPNRQLPARTAPFTFGTLSSSQRSLTAEKYGDSGSPHSGLSWSTVEDVRMSCQTIALYSGSPVVRSHTIVVSRWFVTPIATMSVCGLPPSSTSFSSVRSMHSYTTLRISCGSCSTQPSWGQIRRSSFWWKQTTSAVSARNSRNRAELVPSSIEPTRSPNFFIPPVVLMLSFGCDLLKLPKHPRARIGCPIGLLLSTSFSVPGVIGH